MAAISYRQADGLVEMMLAHEALRGIDAYYPGFDEWFVNKCMPAVASGRDKMVIAESRQRVVGVALVKDSPEERKLRCVRTLPEFEGRGVSIHLIDRALALLGDDKPATSVPEELLHGWSRILVNRFGFDLGWVEKGLYRPGRLEYFFNGAGGKASVAAPTPYGRA